MYSFSYLEPVYCSMSSSNCCCLTCIQISQETGQVVWYSHLFHNFPQFVVIHTVKGFGIVNKSDIDVFLELCCFFNNPTNVDNLISCCFCVLVPKSCLTLGDPMGHIPPGSSIRRISRQEYWTFTISWSLPKLMSIELVIPSHH